LASRAGSGGTEMMTAIRAALDPSDKQGHVRIVCFMTDGYVGNDMEVIGEVQKHPNARVFSFGIGSSVNRFLLDKMAEAGRGEVEYVALDDDGSAAARRFHERVRNPLLTDIEIDWNGLPVADVYPARIPDLFSARPLVLSGRYTAGARGVIRLKGRLAGREFTREIPVELPDAQPAHDVLATLWARTRIDDLMSRDYQGMQNGNPQPEVREAITQLGLEYRLMTRFTSFVAVEEAVITTGGEPRRVDVPVEIPEGVNCAAIFGERLEEKERRDRSALNFRPGAQASPSKSMSAQVTVASGSGTGSGVGRGVGGGVPAAQPAPPPSLQAPLQAPLQAHVSGGVLRESADKRADPVYPAAAKSARVNGPVQVRIVVDEAGKVAEASVISGHPLLRDAALQAARQWQFKPTELSGRPVRAQGVVTFNFDLKVGASPGRITAAPAPLPEERRRQALVAKMAPDVAALAERLRTGAKPAPGEAAFVRNGKAELQVRLAGKSAATIAGLRRLSFEVLLDPKSSSFVIGRLPVEKLEALAGLPVVLYIAPQR
ncbi:MAG: TonB family protein, partial [Blastocatellia bacterium]